MVVISQTVILSSKKATIYNIVPKRYGFDIDQEEKNIYIFNGNVTFIQIFQINASNLISKKSFINSNLQINDASIIKTKDPNYVYLTAESKKDGGSVIWELSISEINQDLKWRVLYDFMIPNMILFVSNKSFVLSVLNKDASEFVSVK